MPIKRAIIFFRSSIKSRRSIHMIQNSFRRGTSINHCIMLGSQPAPFPYPVSDRKKSNKTMYELVCEKEASQDFLVVRKDGREMARLRYYRNDYHQRNLYLAISRIYLPRDEAASCFRLIADRFRQPLQVMISSDNQKDAAFLHAGGFHLKRRCFEAAVSRDDYLGRAGTAVLESAGCGSRDYRLCAERMLEHYIRMHRDINPWTADAQAFFDSLPGRVFFTAPDGTAKNFAFEGTGNMALAETGNRASMEIENFAFLENEEIAYVLGGGKDSFLNFLETLIPRLFREHAVLLFEADDVDPYAMILKNLFRHAHQDTFDTWIYDRP